MTTIRPEVAPRTTADLLAQLVHQHEAEQSAHLHDQLVEHARVGSCEWDLDCPGEGVRVVGELVVCTTCAPKASHHAHYVGDEYGQVLCFCGYYKPKGAACGEPCL